MSIDTADPTPGSERRNAGVVWTPVGSFESICVKQKMNVTYVLILTSCSRREQILLGIFFLRQNLDLTQVQRIVENCVVTFVL